MAAVTALSTSYAVSLTVRLRCAYPDLVDEMERPVPLTARHVLLADALATLYLDQLGEDVPAADLRAARVALAGMDGALVRSLRDRLGEAMMERFERREYDGGATCGG